MPVVWIKTLYNSKILLKGRWTSYMGFHPYNALNSLFYRTQWINIDRSGVDGISKSTGNGEFKISDWSHLSLISSYIYSNAGAVVTLFCTLVWVLTFSHWFSTQEPIYLSFLLILLLLSTTTYAMAFARQNYQIIGWAFVPSLLHSLTVADLTWSLILIAVVGVLNITILTLFCGLLSIFCLYYNEIFFWQILLYAILLLFLRAGRILFNMTNAKKILKIIGFFPGVKYKRKKILKPTLYFGVLYLSCTALLHLMNDGIFLLTISALLAFFVNQLLFRITDEESVIMFFVSCMLTDILAVNLNYVNCLIFWIAASPIGLSLSLHTPSLNKKMFRIPVMKPFNTEAILSDIRKLLGPVRAEDKVLFAFKDPLNEYYRLFDGYRPINEAAFCVAAEKNVNLFPDFSFIVHNNHDAAAEVWGRDNDSLLRNLKLHNCRYVLFYSTPSDKLTEDVQDSFENLGSLDWSVYLPSFNYLRVWDQTTECPTWHLLKLKGNKNAGNIDT